MPAWQRRLRCPGFVVATPSGPWLFDGPEGRTARRRSTRATGAVSDVLLETYRHSVAGFELPVPAGSERSEEVEACALVAVEPPRGDPHLLANVVVTLEVVPEDRTWRRGRCGRWPRCATRFSRRRCSTSRRSRSAASRRAGR